MPTSAVVEVEPARPATGDQPALSPVYRDKYYPKGPPDLGVSTCLELFEHSTKEFATQPCLGWRPISPTGEALPYQWITYKEAAEQAAALHATLEALGLGARDHVGIIGANSPEWMLALQATNRLNGVCIPLYDTLGDNAVEYVVKHAEIKIVISHASKLPLLTTLMKRGNGAQITGGVIYWGEPAPEALEALTATGVKVTKWKDALALGKSKPVTPRRSTSQDVCTIMYTSGTTGNPKGVVLTHRAVLTTISGLVGFVSELDKVIGVGDSYISFLTMAHIFGRVAEEYMLHVGAAIGYWQGDARKLMDDIAALRPTIFAAVPRIFERVYSGVHDQVQKGSFLKRMIYNYAFWRKMWYIKHGASPENASFISDLLVFNKIKRKLGGRLRIIISGGAPIPAHVEEFLKVALCTPVGQGYGLTETCAASFISNPYEYEQSFTVGPPMPGTDLRLEGVAELGYEPTSDPPRGEVCIRGPGLFNGYYKDEEMTKEVLDSDGFFHTGDIGELTPCGALRIIDRKKNLFKLSHGEYIAVERVENVYKGCDLVDQIWVYGNSFESCLVAVVVPREKNLRAAASAAGVAGADSAPLKELLANPAVKKAALDQLKATAKAGKLKGFEEIKDVVLEEEHFAVENDLMTPSFKLKRPQLLKRYKAAIDAMYSRMK